MSHAVYGESIKISEKFCTAPSEEEFSAKFTASVPVEAMLYMLLTLQQAGKHTRHCPKQPDSDKA